MENKQRKLTEKPDQSLLIAQRLRLTEKQDQSLQATKRLRLIEKLDQSLQVTKQLKLIGRQDQYLRGTKSIEKQDQSLHSTKLTEKQDQSLHVTKLTERQDQSLHNDNKRISKSLVIGSIIATLIAITPYLFSLYESVPQQRVWSTFLFTFESKLFDNANYLMWVVTGKLVPLYLLFLWFFTCKHWWYHALLVPIAMYILQTIIVFNGDLNSNTENMDEFQLIYLLPIMAIVIPTIYLIRAQIFNKINTANKSMQELEDEFKLSPKNFWGKIKDYF